MSSNAQPVPGQKIKNNYLDGLPVSRKQFFLYMIIVAAYFFEQVDNAMLGYVAPAVMNTFGLSLQEFAPANSVYFIGMMLGGLTGGIVSDAIGRRKTFIGSIFVFSTFCVLNGLTSNFIIFIISRALTGFGIFSMMVVSITYLAEISPAESRAKWQGICAGIGFMAAPVVGLVATRVVPMAPEAWRFIFLFGALGYIPMVLGFFRLSESPRWFLQRGRVADAEKALHDISGYDIDLSDVYKKQLEDDASCGTENYPLNELFADMFRGKYLRRTLVCALVISLVNFPAFILMAWNTTLMGLKDFMTPQSAILLTTLGTFGAPVGLFLSSIIGDKGGRKIPITIMSLFTAAVLYVYFFHGNSFAIMASTLFLFQIGIMATSFMVMPYISESYPTKMRNTASGAINAFGRLSVAAIQYVVPMIFYGTLSGVGNVAVENFHRLGGFLVISMVVAGAMIWFLGWRTGGRSLEDVC